jgi:Uma2 family endonuclease
MGVQTAIPIEEYLHTSYDGLDREFRDGEVVERSMPTTSHGTCQLLLGVFFMALRERLNLHPISEIRMRLPGNRILIADIGVFRPTRPPQVPDYPPLVAIEVLSPDDRLSEVRAKLEEYRAWGVPHVWLADPESRRLYICDDRFKEVDTLPIPELGIEVRPTDIFD